jgi:carboxysome shell carbonic anhydrase
MAVMSMQRHTRKTSHRLPEGRAPLRRPGAGSTHIDAVSAKDALEHENQRLQSYETQVKGAFDRVVPLVKELVAVQFQEDFVDIASQKITDELGVTPPIELLGAAWTSQLDVKTLVSHLTFAIYCKFVSTAQQVKPLAHPNCDEFVEFLTRCGFHHMDITPCADGRLAHVIRYVLRLPAEVVRRKAYAGAMFAIDDNVAKWAEVELKRTQSQSLGESKYLKIVVYHFSSVQGDIEGCAAHGSDDLKAAAAGRDSLLGFKEAVGQSFTRPNAVEGLLIGLDTATDAIVLHAPDQFGEIDIHSSLKATDCVGFSSAEIAAYVDAKCPTAASGMRLLVTRLIENNLAQLAYMQVNHDGIYADIGHAERFIGIGVGFDEIQLRNLMYFGYLKTVEEGAPDINVGLKIFKGLNQSRGLATPIVIRFDYYGSVAGAKERAIGRANRVAEALQSAYASQFAEGDIHFMQVSRDLDTRDAPMFLGSNLPSLTEENLL